MLTHLDSQGRAHMVDVTDKATTFREATAEARVRMLPATLQMIVAGEHPKGDVFAVARIAGIQAALDLADTGYDVTLVEKNPSVGGVMAQLDKTFPTMDCSI